MVGTGIPDLYIPETRSFYPSSYEKGPIERATRAYIKTGQKDLTIIFLAE